MEKITFKKTIDQSKKKFLPSVMAPPSDWDTTYTSIMMAVNESKKLNAKTTFIMFDQPLFIKAIETVQSDPQNSEISNVVVRLREFHLLMSFLGSIGYIMAESGLKELLGAIYTHEGVGGVGGAGRGGGEVEG